MDEQTPAPESVAKAYTIPSSFGFEPFQKSDDFVSAPRALSFDNDKQRNARNLSKGLSKPGYISFETLRRASRSVHVASICKTTLKEKVTKTKWIVKPVDPLVDAKQLRDKIDKVSKLLKKPNRQGDTWRSFLDKSLEDLLVCDGVFWEKTRYDDGELAELYHVDVASIHPVFNEYGQTNIELPLQTTKGIEMLPVAFLQVLNYSQYGGPESGDITAAWSKEDSMMFHQHPQGSLEGFGYGLSPLEAVLSVVTNILNADNYNGTYFEEGGFPPVILQLVGQMTERDLERYREYLISELQGHFHRPAIMAGQAEAKVINLKDLTNNDMQFMEYTLFLSKLMCAAYGLSPQDIGLTDDVNKSTSDTQKVISESKGYGSVLNLIKEQINLIIENDFGFDDIEFDWVADDTMNEKDRMVVVDSGLKNGIYTLNEARQKMGLRPFGTWANEPTMLGTDGFMMLGPGSIMDPTEIENDEDKDSTELNENEDSDTERVTKSGKKTMYVQRKVKNAQEIIDWAKSKGFGKTLQPDDMHVTVAFSRTPVKWEDMGKAEENLVAGASRREVVPLGDKGAVVLKFEHQGLSDRWQSMMDNGASWDYESYSPHVTLSYDGAGVDPDKIEPFAGNIELGPEEFSEVDDDWVDGVTEKRIHKSVYTAHYKCTMDDRGFSQPFIFTDMLEGTGFVIKPPVAVNLMSQQLEVQISQELSENGLNAPRVKKMTLTEVEDMLPDEVRPEWNRYTSLAPNYDSEKWRSRIGLSRKFPYYLVQEYVDGFHLTDDRLISDMKRDPESYEQAVKDLAALWKAEKRMKLGDRRTDQYIITKYKRGYGFDYQFKDDAERWERTKDALPEALAQIPELLSLFKKEIRVSKGIAAVLKRFANARG